MPLDYSDVLIGALTTAFGAILVMVWDYYKVGKESSERDRRMLIGAKHELMTNRYILETNSELLEEDIGNLKEKKEVLTPLTPFRNEFWNLIKINPPLNLLKVGDFYDIGGAYYRINYINEIIRLREAYRIENTGKDDYSEKMLYYDEFLLPKLLELVEYFEILNSKLESHITSIKIKADEFGTYHKISKIYKRYS